MAMRLAVISLLMLTISAMCPDALAQTCGPFGNPPQAMVQNEVPSCTRGRVLGPWNDSDGTPRYACLFTPQAAGPSNPLPMVIFLHPSLTTADSTETATNWLEYLNSASVSTNPASQGFILLAPEGRDTTHYYPAPDNEGPGWDNWYRQLNPAGDVSISGQTYRENVDAATIDHFASQVTSSGIVKSDQIYISGWSNGAAMGYLYGLSRPSVAAIGVYSAPDPFGAFNDPCPQSPVFKRPASITEIRVYNPGVPTMHVHNDCDIAGICPNGEYLKGQLEGIGIGTDDTIINQLTLQVPSCMEACGTNPDGDPNNTLAVSLGTANHVRWPADWLAAMLEFFHEHPKAARTTSR